MLIVNESSVVYTSASLRQGLRSILVPYPDLSSGSQAAAKEQFPVDHPENPGYIGPDILAFTSGQKE